MWEIFFCFTSQLLGFRAAVEFFVLFLLSSITPFALWALVDLVEPRGFTMACREQLLSTLWRPRMLWMCFSHTSTGVSQSLIFENVRYHWYICIFLSSFSWPPTCEGCCLEHSGNSSHLKEDFPEFPLSIPRIWYYWIFREDLREMAGVNRFNL